jgi:hypothetical protein
VPAAAALGGAVLAIRASEINLRKQLETVLPSDRARASIAFAIGGSGFNRQQVIWNSPNRIEPARFGNHGLKIENAPTWRGAVSIGSN